MRTTRKVALGALAIAAVALVAPTTPASADTGDRLTGGCFADTNVNPTQANGRHNGVIVVASVSQEASGAPSGATVQCWVEVFGVEAPGTRVIASGFGVQANSAPVSFVAREGSYTVCQEVTFDDGSIWTSLDGSTTVDCPVT